jgi:hypothetical protein
LIRIGLQLIRLNNLLNNSNETVKRSDAIFFDPWRYRAGARKPCL